jgi:predicted ATP-dependent endonuclease of OLD family
MGDVAVIGEQNIFVEGITDQIFFANVSRNLQSQGQVYLDLERASIIPYGEEPVLRSLVGIARSKGVKAIVVADSDMQGNKVKRYCDQETIPCFQLKEFSDRFSGDCAIEDVFGTEEYLKYVNEFYAAFDWYELLNCADVKRELGEKSLGAYLENLFKERFDQNFSKVSIAVLLAENLNALSEDASKRFQLLVEAIVSAM